MTPDARDKRLKTARQLLDSGDVEGSLERLKQVLLADHRNIGALVLFAEAQLRWGNMARAEAACQMALEQRPTDIAALNQMGAILISDGRSTEALDYIDKALALDPANTTALRRRANAFKTLGRMDEARDILQALSDADPLSAPVLASLAEVERFSPGHVLIDRMRSAIAARGEDDPALPQLHYALGRALDQIGDYDDAFEQFRLGGQAARRAVDYDEAFTLASIDRIADIFTPDLLSSVRPVPSNGPMPVFIVGMPRSGSTLVEQILSRHPDVHCAGEIMGFAEALAVVRRENPDLPYYPDLIPHLGHAALDRVATAYRSETLKDASDRRIHVNKQLNNFIFMGAIHKALPDARFIIVRRDPLDACLSAFSLHFDQRVPYSYDLGELGRYYAAHQRALDPWQSVLPTSCVHELVYEELVGDLEGEARRLTEFLGLDWNPDCLSFYESDRSVLTASLDQVRRPVYATSIGRWRHYERHLGPLIEALG